MNYVHVGWLILVTVLLGACLCVVGMFFNINRDYINRDFEHSQDHVWLEKKFKVLGKLFKGYMIQNKQSEFFIPHCFFVQAEDHDINFTDVKDGIEVKLMERKNDHQY